VARASGCAVPAADRRRGERQAGDGNSQRGGGGAARRVGSGRLQAREIGPHLLERALVVFHFVAAQCRLDEQPHARRGNRAMQEPIHHAGGDLASYFGLFLGRAHDHQHQVVPGVAQSLGESGEISLDEHAVEQRHRDATRIQVGS
jgi:hypothetical protein